MKKLFCTFLIFTIINKAFSQLKYDDGPIVSGNNFVTVGSWGRSNITFSFQNGTKQDIIKYQHSSKP